MLKGKIALITGGGYGIGQSSALEFARNNAEVIVVGRTESKLVETVKLARFQGKNVQHYVCDVSDYSAVKALFDSFEKKGVFPNIVVNCAGVINVQMADGNQDDDFTINVNVLGTIHVCNAAVNVMMRNNVTGSIINIASIAGHFGSSEFVSYSASKGAILALTKSLAMKYGTKGIRVNSISPGVIVTPMSYVETSDFDAYIPKLTEMHPLGRLGKPEDIAKTALFLASDMSSFITGEDIIVDGGYTLRE